MNSLLNLMHQVWLRPTPARSSAALAAAVPPRRGSAAAPQQRPQPASDLWAWYQSRCITEPEQETPRR